VSLLTWWGARYRIQQAGIGGVATPELAAAVADAGGLGMVSMVLQPADAVAAGLDALTKQNIGQVGINFLMPFLDPEAVEAAASRVRGGRVLLRRSRRGPG
jgi:NAD(P)H-dependent flavin oxidoreductase YrpB (nitropropane dioxygenase family)